MSNPNLTLIAFLLDRSGSMQSIKSDVVGGFDAFPGLSDEACESFIFQETRPASQQ